MHRWHHFPSILALTFILASCGSPATTTPPAAPVASVVPLVAAALPGDPPATCPISKAADGAYSPPPPFDPHGPDAAGFWFGSALLWTLLPTDGVWRQLPLDASGYTQKTFWWRAGYDWQAEPLPKLTVTGKRLDAPAAALSASAATNGNEARLQSFMLVGVQFPTSGCWQVTGHYGGSDLTYVVWVTP